MRPGYKLLCASIMLLASCRSGDRAEGNSTKDVDAIRAAYAAWQHAFEARDVNGIMALYAPEVVAYDIVPPLQFKGEGAYRKDYSEFFSQFKGPVRSTIPDMEIEQSGDTAFAFGLEHLQGTMTDGTPVDTWLRFSDGWKRRNGRWLVVHEHVSVPVDLATGKARLDLKP